VLRGARHASLRIRLRFSAGFFTKRDFRGTGWDDLSYWFLIFRFVTAFFGGFCRVLGVRWRGFLDCVQQGWMPSDRSARFHVAALFVAAPFPEMAETGFKAQVTANNTRLIAADGLALESSG